jgi:hypothetical protein
MLSLLELQFFPAKEIGLPKTTRRNLIPQAVQKFLWQGAKKIQGRSIFSIREGLNFLRQRSQRKFFNSLKGHRYEPGRPR